MGFLMYELRYFCTNLLNRVSRRASGQLVRQGRTVLDHLCFRDVVPNRKEYLFTTDCSCDDSVEFIVRPPFVEEDLGKYNNTEPA